MALDEALMDHARVTEEWVLRVYTWQRPTISLGRHQRARGRYALDRIAADGIDVVRRPTGGRAILHDREITYSVTAPVATAGDLRTSYARINQLLLHALDTLGVHAGVAGPAHRPSAPGLAPCFDEPAAGELMADGRKLAGSAQWRTGGALLQHGSILVADDQTRLAGYTAGAARQIAQPATLGELLGRAPAVGEFTAALRESVRALEDPDVSALDVDDRIRARVSALVVRYVDDAWTWRC